MQNFFTNEVFHRHEHHGAAQQQQQELCEPHKLTFRSLLSPAPLIKNAASTSTSSSNSNTNVKLTRMLICTYIADWHWFALELSLCPFVTPQTEVTVVVNWYPETCNSENEIPREACPPWAEGARRITICADPSNPEPTQRTITVVHPALANGIMHVKMSLFQFQDDQQQQPNVFFQRAVIGSCNLTCDDFCNLRQAFFVAEGTAPVEVPQQLPDPASEGFSSEIERVLRWLSVPRELVTPFLLDRAVWPTLPARGFAFIFSVPVQLQNGLRNLIPPAQSNAEGEHGTQEDDAATNSNNTRQLNLPELQIHAPGKSRRSNAPGANPTVVRERQNFYEQNLDALQTLLQPGMYEPPLVVLRRCVEQTARSVSQGVCASCATNPCVVYQASSVGGITDELLRHFEAATNPALPFPPPPPPQQEQQQEQEQQQRSNNNNAAAIGSSTSIVTPFPSRDSIMYGAVTGEAGCSAITLRYFQGVGTKLHRDAYRSLNVIGPTCHSKILYSDCGSCNQRWIVLGSHNFTADCWAFAKQMLPRNFELSIFVSLADLPPTSVRVADVFPAQTAFQSNDVIDSTNVVAAADSHPLSRFVFLNHKRDYFAALQSAEMAVNLRRERVVNELCKDVSLHGAFVRALDFHWSKFTTEVHDDFGRH